MHKVHACVSGDWSGPITIQMDGRQEIREREKIIKEMCSAMAINYNGDDTMRAIVIKGDTEMLGPDGDGAQPHFFILLDCTSINVLFRGYQRPMKPVPGDTGYFLHAHQLVLSQPTSSEVIKITAPLPSILRTHDEAEEIKSVTGDTAY
ncbi:hypothetical protein Acr_24g0009810 [Actinidia rufa]|uniref:Uncharacterized protein n=1 Tax=Actinidia rufa TaxID=165716 RepID=A0A7J0GVN0_9ERIC|nr:hypothetical protein Acr_24g0009810 [Actinidia rufa]